MIPKFVQDRYELDKEQIIRYEEYFYIHKKGEPFEKTSALPYAPKTPDVSITLSIVYKNKSFGSVSHLLSNYDLSAFERDPRLAIQLSHTLSRELEQLIDNVISHNKKKKMELENA